MVGKVLKGIRIWIKDKYAEFIENFSKPEVKRKIFLRLSNMEKDEEKEYSWTKRLGSNSEIFNF